MSPLGVFALQFLWFLLAWTVIATVLVAPSLRHVDTTLRTLGVDGTSCLPRPRPVVWVFNVFGSLDLAVAGVLAARVGAVSHLEAQWYVPGLGVPLMVVTHVMVFHTLLTRRG